LASTTSPGGQPEFLRQLLEIRHDPQVKGLAARWAGSPDLAEDALQEAYYAVFKLKNPERIDNPRAYFCKVLYRCAADLRGQLATHPADDVADLADLRHDLLVRYQPAPPVEETVSRRVLAATWLGRFAVQRAYLVRSVPGRSPDPVRYRNLIVAVAERMLRSMVSGDVSDADSNRALSAAYPEWFTGRDCAAGNGYQRFRRARTDVEGVLRLVVRRVEVRP
jgi:DNA-directed RNA polymerase specialized sigma24 family protein